MTETSYTKFFDPNSDPDQSTRVTLPDHLDRIGDRRGKAVYVYDDDDDGDIVLAVNVALATGRPLLVAGRPGTGKTSLAAHVAGTLGSRFYSYSVSHRSQARDLQWSFDTVRRLADAQAGDLKPTLAYLSPGILWWAFDRESARWRGLGEERLSARAIRPALEQNLGRESDHAVVLLDEIDKAEPDVPNNLLEALGSYRFTVEDLQLAEDDADGRDGVSREITAKRAPLVILTTNDERELPRAFVRRCICLTLKLPGRERLLAIGRAHFPGIEADLLGRVADQLTAIRERAEPGQALPASAEFIDALAACRALNLSPTRSEQWDCFWAGIVRATLDKRRDIDEDAGG